MRKIFLFTVFLPACLFAQVSDDFSDGDFILNPAWSGDLNHFKVSSSSAIPEEQRPALQLDAPGAGSSALAVSQLFQDDLEWQFWVKLSMNTSSGNFARVYLFSDNGGLKAPLHGYFLQTGGADDSVSFCRQDSLDITRLLCLGSLYTGNSTNSMRFRIIRSFDGTWKFYADSVGGHSLNLRGEINDLVFPAGGYAGIFFQYTSSNTTKFYFDDFYAGPLIVDSIPPALLNARALSSSEIMLTFSEPVEKESAENIHNYIVSPDLGNPYSVVRLLDISQAYLFFDKEMQNGADYMLNISSVKDLAGNVAASISQPVWYYRVLPYDLVFSEIMADPTPSFDLPEYEYLELLNRGPYPINLEGLILVISSGRYELPSCTIGPGNYLLICDSDAEPVMDHLGKAIGLASFNLPNSGAPLQLLDTAGQTLCYIQYDLSWYGDDVKSDGGWSLEMIDPSNPCRHEENWTASVDASGGTPGRENSHAGSQGSAIRIIKSCCLNELEVEVEFSESLDSLLADDTSRYMAEPFLGYPCLATPVSPGFRTVRLQFREEMKPDEIYELSVFPGLTNCIGQEITSGLTSFFAFPQPVHPFGIIINEVLFNPLGDGVDFVELYNRSANAIDLQELFLASVKNLPPNPPDTQSVSISASCSALLPSQYLVLTSDQQKVKDQYYCPDPYAFLEMESFPSFNNDQGYVVLMNSEKLVIDGMHYSEDMHFLMLNSTEGVSLERISPDRLGDYPENWHSASETAGFGTPGYRNSQHLEITADDVVLSIQPEVFSPDGDGRDDQLGIVYSFDSPGKLMTVLIFNAEGRLARTLVNNEMPGTQGIYSWDGTLDDRTSAQNGIYIVYMEVLGMDGKTSHYKKAGVLTRNR